MASDIAQYKEKINEGIANIDKTATTLQQSRESLDTAREHVAGAISSLRLAFGELKKTSAGLGGATEELGAAKRSFSDTMDTSSDGGTLVSRSLVELTSTAIDAAELHTQELYGLMKDMMGNDQGFGIVGALKGWIGKQDVFASKFSEFTQEMPDDLRSLATSWQEEL